MTGLRVWWSRALDFVLRRQRDARLGEEVQAHLDMLTAENIAHGMAPDAARAAAHRDFGAIERMKDDYRDQRGLPRLDSFVHDARFACRLLWRAPGFTAGVVAVLGLGIGINNMLFTILNAHTLRGLPIPGVDRVVVVTTWNDRNSNLGVSFLDFDDWQQGARSFSGLAALTSAPVVVVEDGRPPDALAATFLSPSAFTLTGATPLIGRVLATEDDAPGAAAVALLSSGAWERRYGSDRNILGTAIMVNGTPTTVVGVMPDRSRLPSTAQIWLPLSQVRGLRAEPRSARSLQAIARLRDGVTIADAAAEMDGIAARLAAAHPESNEHVRARVIPINQQYFGSYNDPAWRAFIAVGVLVVLISCANAANLMLARAQQRAREIAVRTTLGASRLRLVRQLCIEGTALAFLSGAAGLGVAFLGVTVFRTAIPEGALPYWIDYSVDGRVLAALVTVSAATVFVFALLPAIQGSRADVNVVLKEGGRTAAARSSRRWVTAFLAAEFGLAVVLVGHSVANVRSETQALVSDAALAGRNLITAEYRAPRDSYATPERRAALDRSVLDRLRAEPSLAAVALASALPLSGGEQRRLQISDRPVQKADDRPQVVTLAVSPGYFAALGLTLVRGRDFTPADSDPVSEAVIVNERFVERFLVDRDPLGARIAVTAGDSNDAPAWLTVAGVAPSVRQRPSPSAEPAVYVPLRSAPGAKSSLIVRSDMDTDALVDLLRRKMQDVDARMPLERVRTMTRVVDDAEWVGRISRRLAMALTGIAVLLAALGLYAVTSYTVTQRTHEIGIRTALGASATQIAWFLARGIAVQLAIGLAFGIVCTKVWDAMFSPGRPGITVSNPGSLVLVAAVIVSVAALACAIPVRRATRLAPVEAMRD